eukprot:scaffold93667_cov40-Tisochrysis_lutea.AAC.4
MGEAPRAFPHRAPASLRWARRSSSCHMPCACVAFWQARAKATHHSSSDPQWARVKRPTPRPMKASTRTHPSPSL